MIGFAIVSLICVAGILRDIVTESRRYPWLYVTLIWFGFNIAMSCLGCSMKNPCML